MSGNHPGWHLDAADLCQPGDPRQQKEADNLALRTLYYAVLKAQKSDPELSLNKVAEQFPLTGHITDFTLTYADDTLITTSKPSPDISDDEWQAFLRSSISADSENGKVSFTLIDLDGDGKRDLIIDSYVGGTGLFSYTGVLKRGNDDFAAVNGSDSDNGDDFDAGCPAPSFPLMAAGLTSGTTGSKSTAGVCPVVQRPVWRR